MSIKYNQLFYLLTETEILNAFKIGRHQEALNALYVSLLPKVKAYILRNSGSVEDAQDVFQDAVLVLYKQIKLNKLDETMNLTAYLLTVAKNLWVNKAKRNKKIILVDEIKEENKSDRNALSFMISKEREDYVLGLLSTLGDQCYELLRLVFYEDYSLADVTEKMNFSSAEVAHTTHYRCKKKLSGLVKGNVGFKGLLKSNE